MNDTMEHMRQLASWLDKLRASPAPTVGLDLMAGALLWSDELPPLDDLEGSGLNIASLRGLLRYRTLLILGQPGERFRKYWDEGKRLFPNWPGFLPERLDSKWASTFATFNAAGIRRFEEADERFEERKAINLTNPVGMAKVAK